MREMGAARARNRFALAPFPKRTVLRPGLLGGVLLGAGVLCSTPAAQAEDPSASVGAEGSSATTAAGTAPSSVAPASEDAAIPAYAGARANRSRPDSVGARFRERPYLQRFLPEPNLWEVGLFLGALFPAYEHNLKQPDLPREAYSGAAFTLGGRVAYFPLPYLGVEVEGFAGSGSTRDTDSTATFYALRGQVIGQLPLWSVVPFVTLGGGVLGATSESLGHDGDPSLLFGLGAKAPINHFVSVRLDLKDNLAQRGNADQGSLTHHFEMQLGATFTFERTPPPPPRDRDYDGLYDSEDACPTVGALTVDGCPGDSDGDGIRDHLDQCPEQAGVAPTGCLADEDQDGVPDTEDACPTAAGPAPKGCPEDTDQDGVVEGDLCPNEPETKNGFEDADGCPDVLPEAIKQFVGVVKSLNFQSGTAQLEDSSRTMLDQAASELTQHPSIRIEVSGHTSSEGSEQTNQQLSVDRANAVRDYLVGKGVAADRVVARGAGDSEPIADNSTPEGRAENRRIEIRVLR